MKTGDMPDGSMSVRKSRVSLPEHDGYGMLQITYDFSPGVYVSNILLLTTLRKYSCNSIRVEWSQL